MAFMEKTEESLKTLSSAPGKAQRPAPIVSFARVEKKFMLPPGAYDRLMEKAGERLRPDLYGISDIRSLYFDTETGYVARFAQSKPLFKEKVRVRRYGPAASGSDEAFLELKKKCDGIVYKRRARMTIDEAMAMCASHRVPDTLALREHEAGDPDAQILSELAFTLGWFERMGGLEPHMLISSSRRSFAGTSDDLRLTFDFEVLWREDDLDLTAPLGGNALLRPGEVLLEVKAPRVMPLWLADALTEVGAHATSYSKYGNAFLVSEAQRHRRPRSAQRDRAGATSNAQGVRKR